MIVIKFGGTSVGSPEAIARVAGIVRSRLDRQPAVVVSAFSGVTDLLYRICSGGDALKENIKALRDRHFNVIREIFSDNLKASIAVQKEIQGFVDFIAAKVSGELSDRGKAEIISCGELMSSKVVCAALNAAGIKTAWVDARTMIVAGGDPLKSEPDLDEIYERVPEAVAAAGLGTGRADAPQAIITQGFICASGSGKAAVLGRGGSDYSASLIGRALNAEAVEIWTDVDGVRTADPRRVSTTRCLRRLSYEQAAEMAHFGAKVLHPLTLEPAKDRNIPVYVLNTSDPDGEHTVILPHDMVSDSIRSVSYKEKILVLTMTPVCPMDSNTFLKKVFDTLSDNKVGVDLISTSNSRISITVDDLSRERLPQIEAALGSFAEMKTDDTRSQISAIGSSASELNAILANDFAPLQDCRIYMVSPGASFVNISFVVSRSSLDTVLNETHKYLIENESGN